MFVIFACLDTSRHLKENAQNAQKITAVNAKMMLKFAKLANQDTF
jgi:hypothetical protein